jgi:lipid II:glycine glycyltransferase (peptidoglycan interpeptide bridge formation enzyme)
MEITNIEQGFRFLNALSKIKGYNNFNLMLPIKENIRLLKDKLTTYTEERKEIQESLKDYNKDLNDVYTKHSKKDENGNTKSNQTILDNGEVMVSYDLENPNGKDLIKDLDDLKEKHKKTTDAYTKKIEEFDKFIKESKDFKPFTIQNIKKSDMPSDFKYEHFSDELLQMLE